MPWMDQVGNLLKQYTGGAAAAAAPAQDVNAHFDQVAAAAPAGTLAAGLAAAFHSDQTPAFGNMLSGLFANSTGEQKAGLLNQLMANVTPAMLSSIAGGGALAGLLKSGGQITPEQAQQVSPEAVQQIAAQAKAANPSIVDTVSNFYAQHTTLCKTLGGAALSICLAKVAQHTNA
ncbi:MAG: hypothetical protein ABSD87_14365 [Candidatus Acidiferrales bacterium]|jgi:hypothetical protein